MSKTYSKQYHFKGSGDAAGRMVCCACDKRVSSASHDWCSAQKTIDKWGDWEYVVWHRECYGCDKGWLKIEKDERVFEGKINEVESLISKYKGNDGSYPNFVYAALKRQRLIDE